MQRKSGGTDWTREPGVVGRIVDDEAKPEPSVEGYGGLEIDAGYCYLVEVHTSATWFLTLEVLGA